MSLFSKIAKALASTPEKAPEVTLLQAQLNTLTKDGRLHARHLIPFESMASLHLPNGLVGVIKDVSYGGLAVRFDPKDVLLAEQIANPTGATLIVLDRQIACVMSPVRVVKRDESLFVGFHFKHESPDSLVFLREMIEPMRCGKSLNSLSEDMRNDRYKGADWTCLRGDGPTDLILKRVVGGGDLEEALMTFRIQESYFELSFKGGKLKTGKSLNAASNWSANTLTVGAQMGSTTDLDKALLRQAVCILANAPGEQRQVLDGLIRLTMAALNLQFTSIEERAA